ncbi:TIGR00730 family Rossman fold protein [Psychrobacter sp. FDAARGOS_221]|uniref:LOG family protein n=1 Tax=Psychrobacter sp. FDAARGOS_221 TaxID=1975705 RepID=UPI000BB52D72|nr:TIGR00730 family Rossman fold protein [Psychrobacter sp. FDAARGOS_221]PNK60717.1 TIGR00730 family Rossman fold protein [Psychrobacter sp. FDAARGOS_221]
MRVAVYCGSSEGLEPIYVEQTRLFAAALGRHQLDVVYGGGKVGLMGVLANAAVAAGLHVIGVIPKHLSDKELAHTGINELILVKDMHERKQKMAHYGDAFVALPGGAGTLEELFEVWTWAQLGLHDKPCAFLNVNGYYDGLLSFLADMVKAGFMRQTYLDMLIVSDDINELLEKLQDYTPPPPKWEK